MIATEYAEATLNNVRAILGCVDDRHIKRAFAMIWAARGTADQMAVVKNKDAVECIRKVEKLPWE